MLWQGSQRAQNLVQGPNINVKAKFFKINVLCSICYSLCIVNWVFFFLPLALWAASKLCSNGLLPEQGQSQPCLGQPVPTPILLLKKACVARQVCSALSIFVASNWISVFNYLESVCIKSAQLTKVMNRDGKCCLSQNWGVMLSP